MSKSIYDLKLHEITDVSNSYSVMRVPGGWIYSAIGSADHTIFVPFDNEFQVVDDPRREELEFYEDVHRQRERMFNSMHTGVLD
jgi:hypothetical protein